MLRPAAPPPPPPPPPSLVMTMLTEGARRRWPPPPCPPSLRAPSVCLTLVWSLARPTCWVWAGRRGCLPPPHHGLVRHTTGRPLWISTSSAPNNPCLPSRPGLLPTTRPLIAQVSPAGPRKSQYCNVCWSAVEDSDARDTKELSASIHRYKESIALLSRTVQELSQVTSHSSQCSPLILQSFRR